MRRQRDEEGLEAAEPHASEPRFFRDSRSRMEESEQRKEKHGAQKPDKCSEQQAALRLAPREQGPHVPVDETPNRCHSEKDDTTEPQAPVAASVDVSAYEARRVTQSESDETRNEVHPADHHRPGDQ